MFNINKASFTHVFFSVQLFNSAHVDLVDTNDNWFVGKQRLYAVEQLDLT